MISTNRNVDLLQSLTYGNGLILWKNFSQDNELYQLIVENGATQIINRYYNRADQTNITGIIDGLVANDNQALTYSDQSRLSGATSTASYYGTRLWTYDGFSAPPVSGKPLAETPGQPHQRNCQRRALHLHLSGK